MFDNRLESLIAVVEWGSYTKAAAKLHLTQPAVSQHIRQLEEEFGCPLFTKGQSSLRLTQEGEVVLRYAKRIKAMYGRLENRLSDLKKGRRSYYLGLTHSSEASPILLALASLSQKHKEARIKVEIGSMGKLFEKLSNYELDAAVVDGPFSEKKFSSILLDTDYLVLAMGKDHPLAQKQSVSVEDLSKEKLVLRPLKSATTTLLSSALESHGLSLNQLNVVMEIDSVAAIKDVLERTELVSVLPRSALYGHSRNLAVRPIEALSLSREINLIFRREEKEDPLLKDFLAAYREVGTR